MAIHSPQAASLGDIEGEGFAFVRQTFSGDELQGVFFGSEEDVDHLEAMLEKEKVRFEGVVYNKNKSGKVSVKKKSLLVNVKDVRNLHHGKRFDFKVIEEV